MGSWFGGKLTGAAVGLVVGGPVGAVVGLAVGHAVDRYSGAEDPDEMLKQQRPPPKSQSEIETEARLQFATHLVALFAELVRTDGTIRREEVRAIRAFFAEQLRLPDADMDFIRGLLKASLGRPVDVRKAAGYYHHHSEPAERLLFVQALYEVALADGDMTGEEQRIINEVVVELDITEADHHTIRSMFFSQPGLEDDYGILGVAPGVDDGALKKAFRTLAARHHPDKVTHLGPDAVALAGKRFAEIKAAYDRIRAARGL